MGASILALLAAIVPFAIWLWKRRIERSESPEMQNRKAYDQIDRDIASANPTANSAHLADDLDELERLERMRRATPGTDHQRGPNSPTTSS